MSDTLSSTSLGSERLLAELRGRLPVMPFATVLGSSVAGDDDDRIGRWHGIGHCLAANGVGVITGGYQGTMSFVAKSVKDSGGVSVGITAASLTDTVDQRSYSQVIAVPDVFPRLEALLRLADLFMVLPGGIGTMVEITAALWLTDRGLIEPKPIILLGRHWESLLTTLDANPLAFRASATLISDLVTFVDDPAHVERSICPLLQHRLGSDRSPVKSGDSPGAR